MTQRATYFRQLQHSLGLLAVLAVAALVLPAARADGPHPRRHDQYKRQVEKLENVWRAAQLSGDVTAMEQLLSDDYVGITISGQVVTKTQQLDRMRNRTMSLTRMEMSDVKVKLIGSTAIVTSLAEVDGINDAQPIHGTFRSTRVYSRTLGGIWKMTNFEATRVGSTAVVGHADRERDQEESPRIQ
jgi:ketosteroid isomerase-like protein